MRIRSWLLLVALVLAGPSPLSEPLAAQAPEAAAEPATKPAATPAEAAEKPAAKHTNRLAKETSPYLLQHAHNPVDWHPWGEEALAKAKAEGKLIFLSIGYSSCHWCHVMERESFHDEEIAAFLNKHFVCIKIDREERPDIDAIYMTALSVYHQIAGEPRGGGWPLSMFLTPEAEPFLGGTYFPARDGDREGMPGFLTIIGKVQEFWAKFPDKIREDAKTITRFTKAEMEAKRTSPLVPLDESLIPPVQAALDEQYDPKYGGFGYGPNPRQPKFPEPSNLVFLIDRVQRHKDAKAQEMLVGSLAGMQQGGIRDHLGGGFHRYSVDRYWQIPHFEKMLYDNGQLASVYAEAFALTGRDDFRRTTQELCDFLLREMRDETGGFYTAIDADSEGEEGKFYRWDKAEVEKALSADEFALFAQVYGLDREPNFEEKFYAPQLSKPLADVAKELSLSEADLEARLVPIRQKLLTVRSQRIRPITDTKLLAADNGLAIGGLADAGRILKEPRYIEAATQAAEFVLTKLRIADGRLKRTYSAGEARLNAYVNDYAFVVDGLLRLHRASGDKRWLTAAGELTDKQIELFADEAGGGFYFTSKDHEALLARGKEIVDTAVPSGNSVSADNLVRLAVLLDRPEYLPRASKTILAAATILEGSPSSVPRMAAVIPALIEARKKLDAK
ncbi:MAG: thioredoxin domain-containing protein [Pirellulaceae bacterium]|nr:thioredoxin domain-containing protein [Pirellulaceae bacterium]